MAERFDSEDTRRQTVLVVVAACGLTVAVLVLAVSMALASWRAALGVARENVRFVSSLVAGQMAMVLLDVEDSLAEMGRLLERLPDHNQGDHDRLLRALLQGLQQDRPYIRGLFLTDAQGRVTDWTEEGEAPDVSNRDYVLAHQAGVRGPFVGRPVINLRREGDWLFGVSLGLRDGEGRLTGIAVALLGLDSLLAVFDNLDLPGDVGLAIADLEGRIYVHTPGRNALAGRMVPGLGRELRNGAYMGPSPLDGAEVVAGSTQVSRYPLRAFAGFRKDQVLAPWRRQALTYGGASLVLVAVAGVFSVLLVRGQVRLARQGRELALLASTDPLTGALNRRAFLAAAGREFARIRRYSRPLSCIMFDLDHFKSINDTYGHAAGDQALAAAAGFIRSRLRSPDLLCRLGGEEFVALLPDTDQDGAERLAEDLRAGLARLELEAEGVCFTLTASFGVTGALASDATLEQFLNRADQALYQAKNQGRNCVRRACLPENWA